MPAIFLFLSSIVGPLAAKILTSLGIGAVTYVGITALLATVRSELLGSVTGMPADVLMLFGLIKLDIAINIMLSAVAARAALSGMNSATGKKTGLGHIGS
jgi:hypothetical protein